MISLADTLLLYFMTRSAAFTGHAVTEPPDGFRNWFVVIVIQLEVASAIIVGWNHRLAACPCSNKRPILISPCLVPASTVSNDMIRKPL